MKLAQEDGCCDLSSTQTDRQIDREANTQTKNSETDKHRQTDRQTVRRWKSWSISLVLDSSGSGKFSSSASESRRLISFTLIIYTAISTTHLTSGVSTCLLSIITSAVSVHMIRVSSQSGSRSITDNDNNRSTTVIPDNSSFHIIYTSWKHIAVGMCRLDLFIQFSAHHCWEKRQIHFIPVNHSLQVCNELTEESLPNHYHASQHRFNCHFHSLSTQ